MIMRITVVAAGGNGLRTLEDVAFAEKLGSSFVFRRIKSIGYEFKIDFCRDLPKSLEKGGRLYRGNAVKHYRKGQTIKVVVEVI